MDVAAQSEDTGTLQALKALDSLESKINQVQVAYQQFYTTIGIESAWKFFLDETKNVINTLNSLPKLFGKIPLGAATVIADAVSIIRDLGLKTLKAIAEPLINSIESHLDKSKNTIVEKARQTGEESKRALTEGFNSSQNDNNTTSILDDWVNKAKEKAENIGETTELIASKMNIVQYLRQYRYSENQIEATLNFNGIIGKLLETGNISQDTANKLRDLVPEELLTKLRELQQEASNSASKINFIGNIVKKTSNFSGLGSALNVIATALDKSTVAGRTFAGVLMTIGGLIKGVSEVSKWATTAGAAFPWLAVATAAIAVVNGIATAYENAEERIERLTKKAEDLNNEAKQVKADYNTLQRSIDKLSELEKKRYDSAEAAEEYQTAVDELADKYPALITGLDELGNATIEAANLDYELEKARQASAEATLAAAKAEREAAKVNLEEAEKTNQSLFNELTEETTINGLATPIKTNRWNGNELYNEYRDDILDYVNEFGGGLIDGSLTSRSFIDLMNRVLSAQNIDTGEFLSWDEESESTVYTNLEKFKEEVYKLKEFATDDSPLKKIADSFFEAEKEVGSYNDIIETSNQIKSLTGETNPEEFKRKITEILDSIEKNNLDNIFPDFVKKASKYNKGLISIEDFKRTLKATEKIQLSTEINKLGKAQQDFVKSLGEVNSALTNWLYNQSQAYENGDIDKYISEKLEKDYQDFYDAYYNNLLPNEQELFTEMFKNRSQYTAEDFVKTFGDKLGNNSVVFEAINSYYEDVLPDYVDLLKNKLLQQLGTQYQRYNGYGGLENYTALDKNFEDLNKAIDNASNIMSADLSSWISDVIDLISDYSSKGLTNAASGVTTNLTNLINYLSSLDVATRLDITTSIKQYGLSSVSALDSIIESLPDNTSEEVKNAFIGLKDSLVYNLPLAIQAYTDKLVSDAEDVQKSIKNISNGMSISEAVAALEKINTKYGENHTLSELKTDSKGNVFFDKDLREQYVDTIIEDLGKDKAVIDERIRKLGESNTAEGRLKLLQKSFKENPEKTFNVSSYEDLVPTLQSLDLIETITENGIAKFKFKAEEFTKIAESENPIVAVLEMLVKQLDNAEQILQYTTVEGRALNQLNAGSYKEYLKTLTGAKEVTTKQLKEIAQGGTFGTLDYKKLTDLREKLNSNYSSLISDALSKGFENIHLEDYDLIDDTIVTSSYKDFVKKYAKLAGKTVEETNGLIVQAIEKDTATTTGAAADAIKNITFVKKDLAYASLDTLQKLADAFGISIEKLYDATDYNTAIQGYKVKFNSLTKEQLENIANYSNSVADSVSDFLNSIIEAINKGIEGKLSFAERDNLIGQLKARGIDTITEADFTKTADGLKLSSDAATRLYQEISKIDALQGKLVFDDLRESLEKTEVKFKNISKTSAEVIRLEKELAKEKAKTLNKDDKKIQKLEQELRLAKDIQLAQSQDGKSFDFMGRDLPSYLEGPKNYWDSVGSAYKAMNESAKSGYMDVQDFYNIIDEMSNLMAMSGNTIQFMGQTIDGSSESAAKLIEAGLSTLSNVDGEGVKVNLTKLSKTLLGGSKEMGKGFDEAVQEMARSQIKIIDGMISLFETIVALEKLGDIDVSKNGIFDVFEIFEKDDKGRTTDFTKKYKETIDNFITDNKEIMDNLNQISVNGHKMSELLTSNYEEWRKAGLSEENFAQVLQSLYEAAISGDYDLDNLMESIKNVLSKTGQVYEFNTGDGTKIVIGYGVEISSDKNGNYKVGDKLYKDPNAAINAKILQDLSEKLGGNLSNLQITGSGETIKATGSIKIGEETVKVIAEKGKVTNFIDANNNKYNSLRELIDERWKSLSKEEKEKYENSEENFIKLQYGTKILEEVNVTAVEITNEEDFKKRTREQTENLAKAIISGEGIEEAAETIGITIEADVNGNISQEKLDQLAELAGIESKVVAMSVSANFADENAQKISQILDSPATEIPVKLNVTVDDISNSGLFNTNTTEGISKDITVTLNDGKTIQMEVTGIDTSTDSWSLKGTINGEPIELKSTEIAGLTLGSDGTRWLLNTIITGNNNEVDLGAAKFTNLIRENDKWILQGTITSSNGLSIPTVDIIKVTHNEDGSYTLESPFYGSMTLTATEFDGLLKGTSYTLPENVVANALINVKPGEGFDGNKPKVEEPDPVEVKVGVDETSYNETQQTLEKLSEDKTKTITVQYKNPDGTVIDSGAAAENFEGELEGSYRVTGLQNSTGNWSVQGIFSSLQEAIDSLKVSPETDQFTIEKIDATGAPIEANGTVTVTINNATVTIPKEETNVKESEHFETVDSFIAAIDDAKSHSEAVATAVTGIKTAEESITHDNVTAIQTAQNSISSNNVEAIQIAANSIDPSHIQAVKQAIDNLSGSVDLGVNIDVSVSTNTANASAKGTINSIMSRGGGSVSRTGSSSATWKQSYAYARGTLMGELGPELYVTNGHYFVAGQNGPEFVDLADDAIVFNHLQTKKLLEHGNAGSRGYAINGDKKATAFAAGTGPAMASATEALAALRQLRAMWQAMLNASAKELGSKAGTGKGSSGSGSKDAKAAKSYIADLERWYNLLRQIEKIERDISRQELLQTKYQNDRIANGDKIYQSYKEQLNLLEQQSQIEKTLATEQRAYYEQRAQDLRDSNFSKVFTFNDEGLMQYTSGAGKGLDLLSTLNATNEYGGAVFSPEEQVALLKRWGFGEDIKYDSSGNLIDETKEGSAESMVQAFWDKVDGWKDELDSLYDSVEEHENKTIELETQQNKIVQAIVDNQIELENKVLEAIENLRQSEIDALQDERDAFAETLNKLVDGLSEALEKERQMYENEDNRKDIQELQQQISILRRSGGSASQIASLQDQLDTKQREAYFAERQQEIDAIKEASDLQLEKMDQQIEVMTEALEYEKANGLLWDDVYTILQGSPESIADFINKNDKQYWETSNTQRQNLYNDNLEKAQMFHNAQMDGFDGTKDSIIEDTRVTTQETIPSIDAIDENIDDLKHIIQSSVVYPTSESSSSSSSDSGGSSSSGSSSSGGSKKKKQNSSSSSSSSSSGNNKITGAATKIGTTGSSSNIGKVSTTTQTATTPQNYKTGQISGQAISEDKKKKEEEKKKKEALNRKRFGTGGLATYTGWAWLDGTPSKPEYVLNAEQTDILRTALIGNQSSLSSLRSTASSGVNGISNSNTYNTTNNDGVNIENITLEMRVESIADDYGADRAGEAIMNKIVQIARKSGARSLSRR